MTRARLTHRASSLGLERELERALSEEQDQRRRGQIQIALDRVRRAREAVEAL